MRTYVVTGAASGIGLPRRTCSPNRADAVVGVDLHDADITADLGTPTGRPR